MLPVFYKPFSEEEQLFRRTNFNKTVEMKLLNSFTSLDECDDNMTKELKYKS